MLQTRKNPVCLKNVHSHLIAIPHKLPQNLLPITVSTIYTVYIYICIYYIYQYIYKYIPAVKKINEASKKGRRMRPDDPGSPHHRCLPFGRPRRVGARAREGRGCVHTSGVRRSRSFCRGWKCVQGMDETQSKSVLKIDGVQDG